MSELAAVLRERVGEATVATETLRIDHSKTIVQLTVVAAGVLLLAGQVYLEAVASPAGMICLLLVNALIMVKSIRGANVSFPS